MKEERKGTKGASKRAARAHRVPEANSRVSSNGLNREHHTSRQETPQFEGQLEGRKTLSEAATNKSKEDQHSFIKVAFNHPYPNTF
jgi:hypothetical protein